MLNFKQEVQIEEIKKELTRLDEIADRFAGYINDIKEYILESMSNVIMLLNENDDEKNDMGEESKTLTTKS